jgi:hypothetical protein
MEQRLANMQRFRGGATTTAPSRRPPQLDPAAPGQRVSFIASSI